VAARRSRHNIRPDPSVTKTPSYSNPKNIRCSYYRQWVFRVVRIRNARNVTRLRIRHLQLAENSPSRLASGNKMGVRASSDIGCQWKAFEFGKKSTFFVLHFSRLETHGAKVQTSKSTGKSSHRVDHDPYCKPLRDREVHLRTMDAMRWTDFLSSAY